MCCWLYRSLQAIEKKFTENGDLYGQLMNSIRSLEYCKNHFDEISKTDLKLQEVFHNYKRHCYNQSKTYKVCLPAIIDWSWISSSLMILILILMNSSIWTNYAKKKGNRRLWVQITKIMWPKCFFTNFWKLTRLWNRPWSINYMRHQWI